MHKGRSAKVLSCAECRRLKVKCDLQFPCKHCVKRGLASICPHGELREGLRGQRVLAGTEDLHGRIAELEDALREATSASHPLLLRGLRQSSEVSESGPSATPGGNGHRWQGNQGRHEDDGAADRLSAYSHLVVEDEPGRSRYYGAASSVYLTRRSNLGPTPVASASTTSLPPPLFDLPSPVPLATPVSGQLGIHDIMRNYLPTEQASRDLVEAYFQSFNFTNIVPYHSFHAKYLDPFYHSSNPARPQQLTVLFLVLALGTVMDSNISDSKDETIRSYIAAARFSLALDPSHSVTLVQICYLYVTYVMNGRRDTAGGEVGWPFLRAGMAVAEAIGLHRDPAQWDLDEEEATERRIVFWEIHGYDVLQSIALGRGQCIADYAIDTGLPDDGDDTGFHCKAYLLTRIWSRINDRQIRISPSSYTDVIAIDDSLKQFERDLPAHLNFGVTPSLLDLTDPKRKRLAFRRNMLLLYLTEARMALHRGWYVRAIKEYPNEPLESPQSRSYLACLEACRTLIGLVRSMFSLHDQQINKRWHFFFHLFSACACLAACVIRAPRSNLAQAVMAELENGIGLFRLAKRDETAHLERLAELGRKALGTGLDVAAGPGQRTEDDNEEEDLDLLSARKTFHRSNTAQTGTSNGISPQDNTSPSTTLDQGDVNVDPFAHFGTHAGVPTHEFPPLPLHTDNAHAVDHDQFAHFQQVQQHATSDFHAGLPLPDMAFPPVPPIPGWSLNQDADLGNPGEFNMDAFLEEMGFL